MVNIAFEYLRNRNIYNVYNCDSFDVFLNNKYQIINFNFLLE